MPGRPNTSVRVADAERERLPRLDGDTPEDLADAELGLDSPHEVVLAHRDAARRHEHVGLETARDRAAMRILVVDDHWHDLDPSRRRVPALPRPSRGSTRRSDPARAARLRREARCPSRGRRRAGTFEHVASAIPAAASAPIWAGPSRVPASATTSPTRASPPRGRTCWPADAAPANRDVTSPDRRRARPERRRRLPRGRSRRWRSRRPSRSGAALAVAFPPRPGTRPAARLERRLPCTANPSIAELGNGGRSTVGSRRLSEDAAGGRRRHGTFSVESGSRGLDDPGERLVDGQQVSHAARVSGRIRVRSAGSPASSASRLRRLGSARAVGS